MRTGRSVLPFLFAVFAPAIPINLAAQEEPDPHAAAVLGLFQFELEGSGFAPMVAVRAGMPIGSVLLVEGNLVAARPEQDTGTSTVLIPEAQLQLDLPFTRILPYMGLGTGAVLDLRGSDGGGTKADFTISGSIGLRTWFGESVGLVVEFRARGMGVDFEGTSAEYTAGAAWKL